jgi:hypothetical protein
LRPLVCEAVPKYIFGTALFYIVLKKYASLFSKIRFFDPLEAEPAARSCDVLGRIVLYALSWEPVALVGFNAFF